MTTDPTETTRVPVPLTEETVAEALADFTAVERGGSVLCVASDLELLAKRITGGSGVRVDPTLALGLWRIASADTIPALPGEHPEVDRAEIAAGLHPSVQGVYRFFEYDHLREGKLRDVSKLVASLADCLVTDQELSGPELTVGLRKLLEAKDCFVRAALPPQ